MKRFVPEEVLEVWERLRVGLAPYSTREVLDPFLNS